MRSRTLAVLLSLLATVVQPQLALAALRVQVINRTPDRCRCTSNLSAGSSDGP